MNKQELKQQLKDIELRVWADISQLQNAINALPDEPEPLKAIPGHVYRHECGSLYLCAGIGGQLRLNNLRSGSVWAAQKDPFGGFSEQFTHLGSFKDWLNKRLVVTLEDLLSATTTDQCHLGFDDIAKNLTRILREREQ